MMNKIEHLFEPLPESAFFEFERAYEQADPNKQTEFAESLSDKLTDFLLGIETRELPDNIETQNAVENLTRFVEIMMKHGNFGGSDIIAERRDRDNNGGPVAYHIWIWADDDKNLMYAVDPVKNDHELARHRAFQQYRRTGFEPQHISYLRKGVDDNLSIAHRRQKLLENEGGPILGLVPPVIGEEELDDIYDNFREIRSKSDDLFMRGIKLVCESLVTNSIIVNTGNAYNELAPENMAEIDRVQATNQRKILEMILTRFNVRFIHLSGSYGLKKTNPFSKIAVCHMWFFVENGCLEIIELHTSDKRHLQWIEKVGSRKLTDIERISVIEHNKKFMKSLDEAIDVNKIKLSPMDYLKIVSSTIRTRMLFWLAVLQERLAHGKRN